VGLVTSPGVPAGSVFFTTRIRRLVVRDGFVAASHPFSRFNRVEFGLHVVGISDAILEQQVYFDPTGSSLGVSNTQTVLHPSIGYVAPTLALTHDNTLFGFVGPFSGSRYRLQVSPAIGGWKFTGALADVRRYFFARPFTLAFRGLFYGRFGRDAGQFPVLLGNPDLIRGYTAGSLIRHECYQRIIDIAPLIGGAAGLNTGCADLDQLIGSRVGIANVELRFPLTRSLALGFLPVSLPPIEGAIFYDVGLAWQNGSKIVGNRTDGEDLEIYRTPLQSWGGSIRVNFLGIPLRFDYARPLNRTYKNGYWTVSLGPTF
jgi:outer membrane protein assembly factor BamA